MSQIQVILTDKQPFMEMGEERISALILPDTAFTSAAVGEIKPGVAQAPHFHKRPQNGVETIFIYQGSFEIVTEKGVAGKFNVERDGPVYIQVPSGVQASIKNAGHNLVKFFSVFAPPFEKGEINYVE